MNKFAGRKSGSRRPFNKQSENYSKATFVKKQCIVSTRFLLTSFVSSPLDSKGMLNGQMNQRVRERIPTPENDNRLNLPNNNLNNPFSNIQSIATGVALTAQNLATNPSIFPSVNNSVPILGTLLLSPINESDSVNNTLTSGSLAPNKPILPLNFKSTKAQFGSLMIPHSSHQDMEPTNSFMVLPSSQNENEIIPVSITSAPLSSNPATSTTAVITELPLDQPDSSPIVHSPVFHPEMHRQHSFDSNTGDSTSVSSTLSKRQTAGNTGKKHNEVYV